MADLMSRPYKPDPAACCEACVFGRGEHAEWCRERIRMELRRLFPCGLPPFDLDPSGEAQIETVNGVQSVRLGLRRCRFLECSREAADFDVGYCAKHKAESVAGGWASVTREFLAFNGITPKPHWEQDPWQRAWVMPFKEYEADIVPLIERR